MNLSFSFDLASQRSENIAAEMPIAEASFLVGVCEKSGLWQRLKKSAEPPIRLRRWLRVKRFRVIVV